MVGRTPEKISEYMHGFDSNLELWNLFHFPSSIAKHISVDWKKVLPSSFGFINTSLTEFEVRTVSYEPLWTNTTHYEPTYRRPAIDLRLISYSLTLPLWKNLWHRWSRDQLQPRSFFQWPREAEKRVPGNVIGSTLAINQQEKTRIHNLQYRPRNEVRKIFITSLGLIICKKKCCSNF